MVEKKSEFVADYTFSCQKAKISSTGVIDPAKTPRRKIFGIRSLSLPLGALLWSKNGHLRPFLEPSVWQTQSSQRQGLTVKLKLRPQYFAAIKKLTPAVAGKAILWSLYTLTQLKKPNFDHFWKAILADSVTVRTRLQSHFEAFFFILLSKEKNLTHLCAKGHLVADLYQYIKKRLFIAFFAHLRLADTEIAATNRQI